MSETTLKPMTKTRAGEILFEMAMVFAQEEGEPMSDKDVAEATKDFRCNHLGVKISIEEFTAFCEFMKNEVNRRIAEAQ